MSDRLREALDYWREGILEGQSDNLTARMIEDAKHFDTIAAAARRFLALTETGRREWRCELTRITETGEVRGVLPGSQTWQECFERRIHQESYSCGWAVVIPADYLTEEETDES